MNGKTGKTGKIVAENRPTWATWGAGPSLPAQIRRCRRCGVRYVLTMGFHRERKGRGGYRSTCKRCRNRQHAKWARSRYVPTTGRRYRTKTDRAAGQGEGGSNGQAKTGAGGAVG